MPAFMRCAYRCDKEPTIWKGDENREKLAQVNTIILEISKIKGFINIMN